MIVQNGLEFLALLALINVGVFWFAKKFPWKIWTYLSPVIVIFLIVACCNTFGIWSMKNESVNNTRLVMSNYAIPFMVFLIGAQTDVKKMVKIGPKLAGVFVATCISIVIGMIVSCLIFGKALGIEEVPGVFGAWTGSFIGGTENLYAVAKGVELSDAGLANTLLLINLVFRPWMTLMIVMMAIAPAFNKWTKANTAEIAEIAARVRDENEEVVNKPIVTFDLLLIMALGFGIVALTMRIGPVLESLIPAIPSSVWMYTLITVISVCLGTFTKVPQINGLGLLGTSMATFMLSINCSNVDFKTFANAGTFLMCGIVCLGIHGVLMVLYAKIAKVDLGTLGIASMATVGGVSSAPVVAGIYGDSYIPISVIFAAMGSMIGTFTGLGIFYLLQSMGF